MADFKKSKLYRSFNLPLKFVLFLWAIQLVQVILPLNFATLGIFPGRIFGLKGILFAPLIHADWGHLLSNTPPLFFLSAIILYFYRSVALRSFIMIYLLTGLAVWLFGRPVFHIGASGVIYGLVAFVFWNGVFRRNFKSIALALIVVFYYGSMVMGVLPGQEGISWESHLLGGLVGIFTSFWYRTSLEQDEQPKKYSWEKDPPANEDFFLDRDVFEHTKEERWQKKKQQQEDDFSGWFSSRTWD